MTQRENEKRQTDTVTQEANEGGGEQRPHGGKLGTLQQRDSHVQASRAQTFEHGDLYRVRGGDVPRQIVVERPGQTGADNRQRAPRHFRKFLPDPG